MYDHRRQPILCIRGSNIELSFGKYRGIKDLNKALVLYIKVTQFAKFKKRRDIFRHLFCDIKLCIEKIMEKFVFVNLALVWKKIYSE